MLSQQFRSFEQPQESIRAEERRTAWALAPQDRYLVPKAISSSSSEARPRRRNERRETRAESTVIMLETVGRRLSNL